MSQNEEAQASGGMDAFTRKYLIFLGVLAVLILGLWLSGRDTRVADINGMLASDSQLAAYPYPFRVLSLENGVAAISTPRSFKVPVIQFLGFIQPELKGKAQDDPAVIAAQEDLVRHQKRAMELVQGQPDVRSVRWVLDENWYLSKGISLPRD